MSDFSLDSHFGRRGGQRIRNPPDQSGSKRTGSTRESPAHLSPIQLNTLRRLLASADRRSSNLLFAPTWTHSEICLPSDSGPARAIRVWLDQQRRVAGRTTFKVTEISQQVQWIHQRSRAHRRVRDRGIRAMTIHQAKNREFDSVIVLWPYNVAGSADRKRRLLYNAITRAKRQAVVIVQNPNRLKQPPFVPDGD